MSTSASGLAGNRPSTPFTSALDADERPSIRQVLQTVLEGPESKHWEQRLQENPSLAAALTSALAATLEEFATGAPTPDAKSPSTSADQRASREPRPTGVGVNATPEAAPEWQTDRKTAPQDKPRHDKRESHHSNSSEESRHRTQQTRRPGERRGFGGRGKHPHQAESQKPTKEG